MATDAEIKYPRGPISAGKKSCYQRIDLDLAAAFVAIFGYLGYNGISIIFEGWELRTPTAALVIAGLALLLVLEALRRNGGQALLLIVLFFGTYP